MSTMTDLAAEAKELAEACAEANQAETRTEDADSTEPPTNGTEAAVTKVLPEVEEERALKGILEAVLFVSSEPVPVARLMAILGSATKTEVEQALSSLRRDCAEEGRGLQLAHIAGGYRLVTKQEYAPWMKRLEKTKPAPKLSRSALESLAIIAYKQPVVRGEIEGIRGVETSGVLRTLLERKLVRIVGRKEVPGRPIMYGTSKFFLEHFGLRDLSELPPLREFKELGVSEQASLPIEEADAEAQVEIHAEGDAAQPTASRDAMPEAGEAQQLENETGDCAIAAYSDVEEPTAAR